MRKKELLNSVLVHCMPYIEDKILKKKVFEESKVIQNKIEKDNPEKIKKEKKSSCSCC